jgi:hypothetical protein
LAVGHLGYSRIVLNRQTVGITRNGTCFAACERRDRAEVAGPESLPGGTVVGKENVAGNLQDDEAKGKDVGGLVVLAAENLGGDVFAVSLAVDALGSRPSCCQAEVTNLEVTIKSDEDIGRLDIKMDKSSLVNCG